MHILINYHEFRVYGSRLPAEERGEAEEKVTGTVAA